MLNIDQVSKKNSYFGTRAEGKNRMFSVGVRSLDATKQRGNGLTERVSKVVKVYVSQNFKMNKGLIVDKREKAKEDDGENANNKKKQRIKLKSINMFGVYGKYNEIQDLMLVPALERNKKFFEAKRASV